MTMGNLTRLTILALLLIPLLGVDGTASDLSIHRATVGEVGPKTKEVSTEELRRILADGSALVLDTRSRSEFEAGHIPGAQSLDAPASTLVSVVDQLVKGDRGRALVLYCNGPFCQASKRTGDQLSAAGFTNVRRYQLGMPIWRALGGPTEVELGGIVRIWGRDQTAVFIDARGSEAFAKGSLSGAINAPVDDLASGKLKKVPLPEDDFNRRVVLFGEDRAQARKLAEMLLTRPWHNVSYFPGLFETLRSHLKDQ